MFTYTNSNGLKYNLCKSYVIVRGGVKVPVYYFMGEDVKKLKDGVHYTDTLPDGYYIVEASKSGKPLVKKSRN